MILLKKALRSIWRGKRSYAACIFLIALGMASNIGFGFTGTRLLTMMDSMYAAQDFGEVFATVKGIPPDAAAILTRLEGIEAVTARSAVDTRVLHEGEESQTIRAISWDSADEAPLNRFQIIEGEAPGRGEILLSKAFATGQGLAVGDSLSLLRDGQQMRPVISGIAIAPDFIAEDGNGITAGYGYMPPLEVDTLADNGGMANELIFRLADGVTFGDVEAMLEDALARYGLTRLYDRMDHGGHYSAWSTFANMSNTAGMISGTFLTVAILVLYILLRRVIEQERTQIGTMKAFGFSNGRILCLYLGYGAVIGLLGALLGILGGLAISEWFTATYLTFLSMPAMTVLPGASLILSTLALSVAVGLGGAAMGARAVLKLSPAESMRPPAPPMMKKKRARAKASFLPSYLSMALRSISRARFRSAFVAMGMAVSFAILTFMSSYGAITNEIVMTQFDQVQHYDVKLAMEEPKALAPAVQSAVGLPGIDGAEGMLELPVTIYKNHLYEEVALTGLQPDSRTYRLYDSARELHVPLPDSGAVISRVLADKLGAGPGDTLTMTTAYTGDDRLTLTVAEVLGENRGPTAYMELAELCTLLGTEPTVNSLLLESGDIPVVKEKLENAENTAALYDQKELRATIQADLDASLGVNVGIFAAIGFGIAFAIIVSSASISLSERSREYATLRVLGLSPGQVGKIIISEYVILTLLGFLPGIPMAIGFRALLMTVLSDDPLSLTLNIAPVHYLVGAAVCIATALLANLSSIRQIARLEMTDVLKERE